MRLALLTLQALFYGIVGAVGGMVVFLIALMVAFGEIQPAIRQLLGKPAIGHPIVVPVSAGYIAVALGAIIGVGWVIWPKLKA